MDIWMPRLCDQMHGDRRGDRVCISHMYNQHVTSGVCMCVTTRGSGNEGFHLEGGSRTRALSPAGPAMGREGRGDQGGGAWCAPLVDSVSCALCTHPTTTHGTHAGMGRGGVPSLIAQHSHVCLCHWPDPMEYSLPEERRGERGYCRNTYSHCSAAHNNNCRTSAQHRKTITAVAAAVYHTLFSASNLAPCCNSRVTTLALPFIAALWRGVSRDYDP